MGAASGIPVILKFLAHGAGLPLPAYQTQGAAGCDLHAATPTGEKLVLAPGERRLVPAGIALELPEGFEAQIRPRSGLALKEGVTVLNAPGTIDADYRGEICVLLINHGDRPFEIVRGARIAQLVVAPVVQASFVETQVLGETARGTGGFGSTEQAKAEGRS
jgi:dUTP pyrophosphatase